MLPSLQRLSRRLAEYVAPDPHAEPEASPAPDLHARARTEATYGALLTEAEHLGNALTHPGTYLPLHGPAHRGALTTLFRATPAERGNGTRDYGIVETEVAERTLRAWYDDEGARVPIPAQAVLDGAAGASAAWPAHARHWQQTLSLSRDIRDTALSIMADATDLGIDALEAMRAPLATRAAALRGHRAAASPDGAADQTPSRPPTAVPPSQVAAYQEARVLEVLDEVLAARVALLQRAASARSTRRASTAAAHRLR